MHTSPLHGGVLHSLYHRLMCWLWMYTHSQVKNKFQLCFPQWSPSCVKSLLFVLRQHLLFSPIHHCLFLLLFSSTQEQQDPKPEMGHSQHHLLILSGAGDTHPHLSTAFMSRKDVSNQRRVLCKLMTSTYTAAHTVGVFTTHISLKMNLQSM